MTPPARCPNCQAAIKEGSTWCPLCGGPLITVPPGANKGSGAAWPAAGPMGPGQLAGPTPAINRVGVDPGLGGSRPPPPRMHPGPTTPPASSKVSPALVVAGAILAALAIVALAWLAYPKRDPRAGASASESANGELETGAPKAGAPTEPDRRSIEPTSVFAQAVTRGTQWNRDAVLIELRAEPMVAGGVPVDDGGKIEVVFGVPTGKLGPGSRVGPRRLRVTFTGAEPTSAEELVPVPGRGIAGPTCTALDAWRAAVASGVPSSTPVSLRYVYSEKHERAVWNADAASDPRFARTIDGERCTILTR